MMGDEYDAAEVPEGAVSDKFYIATVFEYFLNDDVDAIPDVIGRFH